MCIIEQIIHICPNDLNMLIKKKPLKQPTCNLDYCSSLVVTNNSKQVPQMYQEKMMQS